MLPASQSMAMHRGAPFDARVTVPVELPVSAAAFIVTDASGETVLQAYASPTVVVDPVANTVDLSLTGDQVEALAAAGATGYQLDVQSGGSDPRILRGRIVWVQGVRPSWPS